MKTFEEHPLQREATQHETQLLGSMLHGPEFIDQVASIVDPEHFRDRDLAKLYAAFLTIHAAGRPVYNLKLLGTELKRMNASEDISSQHFLNSIFLSVVNAAHAIYHAREVRHAAHKRRLHALACEINSMANDASTSSDEDLEAIRRKLSAMTDAGDAGASTVFDVAKALVTEITENSKPGKINKPGIFTGLLSHDSATGPVMPGELCILAARPGCGKTALAMQWAMNLANSRRRTLFVSLEMKDRELVGRLLAPLAGVASSVIRAQQAGEHELQKLRQAAESLRETSLVVWDQSRATIQKIKGIAKYTQATGGLDAMFVDYLGLIKHDSRSGMIPRHEQIGQMTGELKALAKELEVPIVCLCQLNREADGQTPVLSNLRESGSIEQDADMVLFIHHEKTNDGSNHAKIIVAKNRHGSVGACTVFWIPEETRFTEATGWQP